MDNKSLVLQDKNKKGKYQKILNIFYKKINYLSNHIDYLYKNKYILQDFYVEKMYIFSNIQNKINILENNIKNKKNNKKFIDNFIEEINDLLEKICMHIGSENIYSILHIFNLDSPFYELQTNNFKLFLDIYNIFFIPLSVSIIEDTKNFLIDNEIVDTEIPNVLELITTKKKSFIEKIEGASIILFINEKKILKINGIFKNDSLGLIRQNYFFKKKIDTIEKEIEYLNLPLDFKNKYLEQLTLHDLVIYDYLKIVDNIKNDYDEYLKYKSKSLSNLVKEFIKMSPEKQRKIIILFLISDDESQFTAHIIYDLIVDQSFLFENERLADVLFNSLHWKIQKIFKISHTNFENTKKKIENTNINDIPYESKILLIKANDIVKGKALEKLKEINGSKENSIKAQQWLDGLLKIPFGTYIQEDIINFLKKYQSKFKTYIDIFGFKITDYNIFSLNENNKQIYNIIIELIDEYYSNIGHSEYSYNKFVNYLKNILINIKNILISEYINKKDSIHDKNKLKIINEINKDKNDIFDSKKIKSFIEKIYVLENTSYNIEILNQENEETFEIQEIEEIYQNNTININDENEKKYDNNYNNKFNKFILRNIDEYNNFITEWENFINKKKEYMKKIDNILDKCTYGQYEAKNQMKRIVGQWINGNSKGQCIGLHGPAGIGKTTLCKNGLAKCLFDDDGNSRPFAFLPLGGATNGSILEGHHYTYLGSTWGKIVDILMETKCMNPIIYIDELDKISKTEHGREIISILTHITDQSQNTEFFDRYFASVPIDLSQVLFIFSYNNRDNIDRILLDRIQEIHIDPLSSQEKLIISQNYVLPEIFKNVGFDNNEIKFKNDVLENIINQYTYEPGIRKLNEILYDIVREVNLKKICGEEIICPFLIDDFFLEDVLSNKTKITPKKINNEPKIGLVNGLYATSGGLGGITIIQAKQTISDKKFGLEKLTGSQGDVMKESMACAFTLASNLINKEFRKNFEKDNENFGVHIHCPDGATPKDGPSAGLAITTCLISLITKIPIKNDIAMTGEVDLEGKAGEIGGLYSKIQGALNAGVKCVLVPRNNEKDLDIIFRKEEMEKESIKKSLCVRKVDSFLLLDKNSYCLMKDKRIFRNELEIILVDTIYDVLKYALVENDFNFNQYV
jgi:ATP-dependent Lon protease